MGGPAGSQVFKGRHTGSQGVKGWAYEVTGGQWVGLQLPPIVVDLILKPKCCRNGVNDLTVRGGAIEVHCLNGSCEAASAKETIGYS